MEKKEQMMMSDLVRSLSIDTTRSAFNDDGTLTFSLSSEEPYARWYRQVGGYLDEILSHSVGAVDLTWLKSGNAPVLNTHSRWGLGDQIGVVTDAFIRKKRVYVVVRFTTDPAKQGIVEDIKNGIIRNVSVGYEIDKYELDEKKGVCLVTKWKPTEASFVPLPADTTVGIGRAAEKGEPIMDQRTNPNGGGTAVLELPGAVTETDEQRAAAAVEAANEITTLAQTHNKQGLARDYIKGCIARGEQPSLPFFKGIVAMELPDDKPLVNSDIGLTDKEKRSFSLRKLMVALDSPDDANAKKDAAFELEACTVARQEASGIVGNEYGRQLPTDLMNSWGRFTVDGVEYDARDVSRSADVMNQVRATMLTSGNPNILTVDHLDARFIDNLRNMSAIVGSGATVLNGLTDNVEIPGGDNNITASFIGEDVDAPESNPSFRKVELQLRDLAVLTLLSRRFIRQSTIAVEAYVRMQQIEAVVLGMDSAFIYGDGLGVNPEGLFNITGVGSVTFAAANPTRDEIIDMRTAVATSNVGRGVTFAGNSVMVGDLQKTKVDAGSGRFLMDDDATRLVGNPFRESNQYNDGDLVAGRWSDFLIGMWGGIQIDRSTERKFDSAGIAFRTIVSTDCNVSRVGSFCIGNDGV